MKNAWLVLTIVLCALAAAARAFCAEETLFSRSAEETRQKAAADGQPCILILRSDCQG